LENSRHGLLEAPGETSITTVSTVSMVLGLSLPSSLAAPLAAFRPCFRTRATFSTFCALVAGMLAHVP
jgi:hypothetical protein